MLETFMQQFVQELELDQSIAIATAGAYTIPLEEDVKIAITALPQGFSLNCNVIACPTTNKELFLTKVLHGNLFGQGTHHAVLGLNENGNLLTLSRVIDYNVDYKDFREALEDFINTVDFWRQESVVKDNTVR